jgi:hypothetical protein
MSAQTLDSPVVVADALRSVNFFNGRLLTGDDLRSEQATARARLARLGRAAGEGIAHGLEVRETIGTSSKAKPVVTVTAGLALTRSGQTIELAREVDVALARERPVAGAEPGGLFADCQPFAPGTYTSGAGVYLLTIAPAWQGEGRAQTSGLTNAPSPCNVATSVEAVRFRLIRLALASAVLADKARLRSRVAYACFGVDDLAAFVTNPSGPAPGRYGLLDALRGETLTEGETALAVIGWTRDDGIQFVDMWAARREIASQGTGGRYGSLLGERRSAEGEAMILQFQAHAADLLSASAAIRATDHFVRLPPLGLLPQSVPGAAGFDIARFFAGLTTAPPVHLPGSKLAAVCGEAIGYPPIAMGREAIRLYFVRENRQDPGPGVAPYVVFANGHVSYRADAEYDLAYWNFANYAQCC